ncbi:MAG: hypothetical protein AAF713_08945 [Pseudomonadota bacterium]
MTEKSTHPVNLPHDLHERLKALGGRDGYTLDEITDRVLRAYVEIEERAITEHAEDERRWQRYLETGICHPIEDLRSELRRLAGDAARQSEV